jgi:hypothetical protein
MTKCRRNPLRSSNLEERTSTKELVGEILQEGGGFKVLQDKRSRSIQEKQNHSRPSDLREVARWLAVGPFENS